MLAYLIFLIIGFAIAFNTIFNDDSDLECY